MSNNPLFNVGEAVDELVTIGDFIRWGASRFNEAELFFGHGTDNAWDESVLLVLAAVNLPWDVEKRVYDSRLTSTERERIVELLFRRIEERVPAAYLTHQAWFCGMPFYVDERVLVPRSRIAEMIQQGFAPYLKMKPKHILDMCTGSGCIGIAAAMKYTQAEVDLVDLSDDALDVAQHNIELYGLDERVIAMESNLFENVPPIKYDLILTNPPYVDADDLATMPAEFHQEPVLGLEAGDDGLDLAKRILRAAPDFLSEDGLLVCEVGNSEVALQELFPQVPFDWQHFKRGGHGVFVLTARELVEHQAAFAEN